MPEQDIFENEVELQADLPQNVQVNEFRTGITVGDVTTLPAGTDATVENVGTDDNVILNFGIPKGDAGSMWGELTGDIEAQTDLHTLLTGLRTDVDAKAPLASPTLTGTPTAPTAVDGTDTTQIATTAFVKNAITNLNNSLISYINTAVANVLKRMDFSNTVSWTASMNSSNVATNYNIPSKGYIVLVSPPLSSHNVLLNNKLVLAQGTTNRFPGELIPVSAGDYINIVRTGTASAVSASGQFVPERA